ncbi:MAG TPA: formyltetrahydrofolate deformylase [Chthonomonadales bacterium]|nr:formyltetrahydrofolate deformylase [Chthonomonadales bacterium]
MQNRGRLLVGCADQPGIVAAIARFLFESGANIVDSDQHSTDPWGGTFFLRTDFEAPDLQARAPELRQAFQERVADHLGMRWRLSLAARRKRLAVFVSREDHCLQELLWQQRSGDLAADIAVVVSNHARLKPVAERWGAPYAHIPLTPETRADAEIRQRELLEGRVDAIVLARYMQILSPEFVAAWRERIINIHHSFLPAFVGARPYQQAHDRGVKLIGATAHYVTEQLDQGPIIEQDVERVDHRCSVDDLKRIGRQIERVVLARAVRWHVEDRVLVHGNKTVVFA